MKPFDYQLDWCDRIRQSMRRSRRVIGQLPTGGGKGVAIAYIAKLSIEKGFVPCISVHRIEIFEQIYKNLRAFGIMPTPITAGEYPMGGAPCYLSMVETFCRRMTKGLTEHLGINFFILDEVHLGNYYKLINNTKEYVLGVTATPKSTGKPELNEYMDELVVGPSINNLIQLGRLVKPITFSVKHDFSKVKKKGKDFDDRALFEEFKKPKLWHGAVDSWFAHAKDLPTICYSVNVEHSNATMLQFRERGIRAAHVDGKTSTEDRAAIFKMFREREYDVLCNVGVATTGTDIPHVQCIIQNFATMSVVKHIQTAGRGARCDETKENFIIIDQGRNYLRHGEFGEEINWQRIFEKPTEAFAEKKERKKRECEQCGMVIRLTLKTCPYCQHTVTDKEIEQTLLFGASIEEIRNYRLKHLPPDLRKPISSMSYEELVAFGHHMGYKLSWANIVYAKRRK